MFNLNTKKILKPENLFLILFIVGSILINYYSPLFPSGPDARVHFLRVATIDSGEFSPIKLDDGYYGFYLPREIINFPGRFDYDNYFDPNFRPNFSKIQSILNEYHRNPLDKNEKDVFHEQLSWINPAPYLPQIIGFGLGKIAGFPIIISFLLARFFNWITALIIVYFAIKITPIGKNIFLALSILPTSIVLLSSISYEALQISLSFLIIAYFLKLILDKGFELSKKRFLFLLILVVIFISIKAIYFPISFLFLLIPFKKFKNIKSKRLLTIFFLSCSILTAYLIVNSTVINRNGLYMQGVDSSRQISYILGNPLEFTKVYMGTIENFFPYYLKQFLGITGLDLETGLLNIAYLTIIIFLIFFINSKDEKFKFKFNLLQRISFFAIFTLIFQLIFISLYVATNPVGFEEMVGIQGRYFISIFPLLILSFYDLKINTEKRKVIASIIILIAFIISFYSFKNRFNDFELHESLGLVAQAENYLDFSPSKEPTFFQTFRANFNGLSGVDISFLTKKLSVDRNYEFILMDQDCKNILSKTEVSAYRIRDTIFTNIQFNSIPDSKNKIYCFTVVPKTIQDGNLIAIQLSKPLLYNDGELVTNGESNQNDILFKLFYKK